MLDETLIRSLLGTPYSRGGTSLDTGLDCWGLVHHLYAQIGLDVPIDPYVGVRLFHRVPAPYQCMDVLVFRLLPQEERHVGVALNARWFLQSGRGTNGVARCELTREPWRRVFRYGMRLNAPDLEIAI